MVSGTRDGHNWEVQSSVREGGGGGDGKITSVILLWQNDG